MKPESYRLLFGGFLLGSIFGAAGVLLLQKPLVPAVAAIASSVPASVPAASAATNGGHVYLSGQVHKQGAIEIQAGETLTVSQAIILNGGLGDFADKRKVKLVRAGLSTDSTPEIVDLAEILDQGHLEKDPRVGPGDLIIVPQRLVNF